MKSRTMRAGVLRQWITIQQNIPTRNSAGEEIESWSDVMSTYASIQPLRVRDVVAADSRYGEASVEIRMRFVSGITSAMRIEHNTGTETVYYDIVGQPMDFRDRGELRLLAAQGLRD